MLAKIHFVVEINAEIRPFAAGIISNASTNIILQGITKPTESRSMTRIIIAGLCTPKIIMHKLAIKKSTIIKTLPKILIFFPSIFITLPLIILKIPKVNVMAPKYRPKYCKLTPKDSINKIGAMPTNV